MYEYLDSLFVPFKMGKHVLLRSCRQGTSTLGSKPYIMELATCSGESAIEKY